jgi:hypothetical protein
MKTKQDFQAFIRQHGACGEGSDWVDAQPDTTSAQDIWDAIERPDWALWIAGKAQAEHKVIVQLACVFARSVLHLVPAGDDRPRRRIETVEAWIRGEASLDDVRTARRQTATDAATYVAYAAADASDAYASTNAATCTATCVTNAATCAFTCATNAATYAISAATCASDASDAAELNREFCKVIRKAIPKVPL